MDARVAIGSREYFFFLMLLLMSRAADLFSTWIATPNLVLEGNPIAKRMGWKWGTFVNLTLCGALGVWPLAAIIIATTSFFVAAHNFQFAWLMRTLGELDYRDWFAEQLRRTNLALYLVCLFGQTTAITLIGGALILFSQGLLVPFAIGLGTIGYASAVLLFTLLGVWRMRRRKGRMHRNPLPADVV